MNMSMNTPGLVETENLISKRGKITPAVMALASGAFSTDSNDISSTALALANPFNQMWSYAATLVWTCKQKEAGEGKQHPSPGETGAETHRHSGQWQWGANAKSFSGAAYSRPAAGRGDWGEAKQATLEAAHALQHHLNWKGHPASAIWPLLKLKSSYRHDLTKKQSSPWAEKPQGLSIRFFLWAINLTEIWISHNIRVRPYWLHEEKDNLCKLR